MKRFFIVNLLLLKVFTGFSQGSIDLEKAHYFNPADTACLPELPYMWDLINNYSYYYCQPPSEIKGVIHLAEECLKLYPDYFDHAYGLEELTLPNLINYQDNIELIVERRYAKVTFKNCGHWEYFYVIEDFSINPCNHKYLISNKSFEYSYFIKSFDNGRFFDKNNFPLIDSKNAKQELSKIKLQAQKGHTDYKSYEYEGRGQSLNNQPISVILEYRYDDGLYLYCEKQKLLSDHIVYNSIQDPLKELCDKYNLSRIILTLLDFQQ